MVGPPVSQLSPSSCLLFWIAVATIIAISNPALGNHTRASVRELPGQLQRSPSHRVVFPGDEETFRDDRGYDAMSECDALVRNKEGWIFTPNYPSDYENNRVCSYVIKRLTSDTCRVEMVIIDFDLEDSPNCLADYLDLRDGQQGVLCGSLASGTKKQLQFRSGQQVMTLRFKSDGETTMKGFMIQLKQIPRSCGATTLSRNNCNRYIDSFTTILTSPGFPNGYGPNLYCAFTIRRADPRICKVLLEFRTVDLGRTSPTGTCREDYLQFPDRTRICQPYPNRKILDFARGSDLLTFNFISDGYRSGKGFEIELLQVPDSCSGTPLPPPTAEQCDQEVDKPTGHFTSPRFPNPYGPNERCRYTLRKVDPSVCTVELDFREFEVEYSGPSCNKDYLTLPNLTRLCGTITGKQLLELPKESNYVNLYFVSDAYNNRGGFDIHVSQLFNSCGGHGHQDPCDQEIGSYNGRFTSPGYPSPYPTNQRCTYTIHRADPSVCTVELDFRKFDLQYSRDQCSKDFLLLPDRSRLCGSTSGIRVMKFPVGSDVLALNFFSDSYHGGRGFDIGVTQRRNSCGVPTTGCSTEISATTGRISSPNYPRYYPHQLRCVYKIRRPEPSTCTVELDIRDLDIAVSAGCSEDYLQLPGGSRICGTQTTSSLPKERDSDWCIVNNHNINDDTPVRIVSLWKTWIDENNRRHKKQVLDYSSIGSDVMTLHFVTDSIGAGRGFDIVVRQLPNSCSIVTPSAPCDMTVTEERDVIHSPNYPEDYPANSHCVYTIRRLDSSVCQVRIDFVDFDIEDNGDCAGDYLEIEKTRERFCGIRQPLPKVITFDAGSPVLTLVFVSDAITSRRGFEARIRQMKSSCHRPVRPGPQVCGTHSDPVSYIQSENFPLPYPPNIDCEYKIVRSSDAICQVELYFSHFDVATDNSAVCDKDYLEVRGAKYCGKRDGQRVLVDFPLSQNEISLRFKTDTYHQLTGFRIEVKQLTSGCVPTTSEPCHQTFSGETFQIISPGYQSGAYPNNQECQYTVKKSSFNVCALQVKFYTFDIEQSTDCSKDYLEISDQKLCGRMQYDSVRTYQFLEDEMEIKFHSDSYKNGAGFFILVEQKTC